MTMSPLDLLATHLCAFLLVESGRTPDPTIDFLDHEFTFKGRVRNARSIARVAVACEREERPSDLSDDAIAAVLLERFTSFPSAPTEGEA